MNARSQFPLLGQLPLGERVELAVGLVGGPFKQGSLVQRRQYMLIGDFQPLLLDPRPQKRERGARSPR